MSRFIFSAPLALTLASVVSPSLLAVTQSELVARVGEPILLPAPVEIKGGERRTFARPGATFISIHLSRMTLGPDDQLLVGPTGGELKVAQFRVNEAGEAFLAPVSGGSADVAMQCATPGCGVTVDRFVRGLTAEERAFRRDEAAFVQRCGADDAEPPVCIQASQPVVYERARAVARLMRGGEISCTGWLFGSDGTLLTNHHCIATKEDAAAMTFEFLAESDTCEKSACGEWGACPGRVRVTGAKFIWASEALDYAVVQLPQALVRDLGFLRVRGSLVQAPPVEGRAAEQIYIPQHPAAQGKVIAFKSSAPQDGGEPAAGFPKIGASPLSSCLDTTTVHGRGYHADTDFGSSGAPVLAFSDHTVIALHQCPGCPNTAISMRDIVADMVDLNILPPDAVEP